MGYEDIPSMAAMGKAGGAIDGWGGAYVDMLDMAPTGIANSSLGMGSKGSLICLQALFTVHHENHFVP